MKYFKCHVSNNSTFRGSYSKVRYMPCLQPKQCFRVHIHSTIMLRPCLQHPITSMIDMYMYTNPIQY